MDQSRRLFIASELPDSVVEALTDVQARLRREGLALRFEQAALMHLTLCFLGATRSDAVPQLAALLRDAGALERPFDLRLGAVNAFPQLTVPRVVWVGLDGAIDALTLLAGRIASAVAPFREAREDRPFHPHLTIGRTRSGATYAERRHVGRVLRETLPVPPVSWTVDGLVLFESRMSEGKREYLRLATAPLGRVTAGHGEGSWTAGGQSR